MQMIDLYWKKYYGDVENWSSIERFDAETAISWHLVAGCDLGCVAFALCFLVLRLSVRFKRNLFNAEDVLLILAWTIYAIAMSLEVTGTWYRQDSKRQFLEFLPPHGEPSAEAKGMTTEQIWERVLHYRHMVTIAQRVNWIMKLFFHAPVYFVKFAWILFYYTLVPQSFTRMRYLLHCTLFISMAGFITTFVVVAEACDLNRLFYGICYCSPFLMSHVMLITFIFHAVSEILVYTIPLLIIFRLKTISIKKKMSVAILFILGFFCLFLMIYNILLASSLLPKVRMSKNPILVALFWPLEPAWAIMITCLPAAKSLVDQSYKDMHIRLENYRANKLASQKTASTEESAVSSSDYSTVKSVEELKPSIIVQRKDEVTVTEMIIRR